MDPLITLAVLAALAAIVVVAMRSARTSDDAPKEQAAGDLLGDRVVMAVQNPPGLYDFDIVGEAHYQPALDRICGGKSANDGHRKEVTAWLITEDDNAFDDHAVKVVIDGRTVGYLSREDARELRARLKQIKGFALEVPGMIVGGWDYGDGRTGHYGVKLDLPGEQTATYATPSGTISKNARPSASVARPT